MSAANASDEAGDVVELRCDNPQLLESAIALIQSPTDEDKKRLLLSRPGLLSDETIQVLTQVEEIHSARGDASAARSINGLRDIVDAGITRGVEFAFARQLVFQAIVEAPEHPSQLDAYLTSLGDRYPELLAAEAARVLDVLATEEDTELDELFDRMRVALHRARESLELQVKATRPDADADFLVAWNLIRQFELNGDVELLGRAIRRATRAIARGAAPARLVDVIGIARKLRFQLTANPGDVQLAVVSHRRACAIGPSDDPAYPAHLDHLSLALRASYSYFADPATLDEAITVGEQLRGRFAESPDDQALAEENLASSLLVRFQERNDQTDLLRAIEAYESARAVTRNASTKADIAANACTPMLSLALLTRSESRLASARELFHEASSWYRMAARQRFILGYNWTFRAYDAGLLDDAIAGFELALRAVRELVFRSEKGEPAKRDWIRDFQWLVEIGAYALSRQGRLDDAVVALESALGLLLADRRRTGGADAGLQPNDVSDAITLRTVQARLDPRTAAVYLVSTRAGGVMLIASDTRVSAIWCESFRRDDLLAILFGEHPETKSTLRGSTVDLMQADGYLGAFARWRHDVDHGIVDDHVVAEWAAELRRLCGWLWDVSLGQVVQHPELVQRDRLVFVPVGQLAGLPLHAAFDNAGDGRDGDLKALIESYQIMYAPSLAALCMAEEGPQVITSALAVGDAETLHFAAFEATTVVRMVGAGVALADEALGWPQVSAQLSAHDVWHFACHSAVDPNSEELGQLLLSGAGGAAVGQIIASKSDRPRLVVLSACSTGTPNMGLLTEAISVATDFIAYGAPQVVATLWPVDDAFSCLFIARLYAMLRELNWDVALALAMTQRWFCESRAEDAVTFVRSLPVDSIAGVDAAARLQERIAASWDPYRRRESWGAFVVFGGLRA